MLRQIRYRALACSSMKCESGLLNDLASFSQNPTTTSLCIAVCDASSLIFEELCKRPPLTDDVPSLRKQEIRQDFQESRLSLIAVLKSCAEKSDFLQGSRLHAIIIASGLHIDICVGNTLISMYAKCGAFSRARDVLRQLVIRDVISWSALISGYVRKRQGKEALDCYDQMLGDGVPPNAFTYSCILKACGIIQDLDRGIKIHEEIGKQRLLEKDIVLGNALVDMYVKNSAFAKAQQVLDELSIRDVVSWSTLIAGFAQDGRGREALNCYEQMLNHGVSPDAFTYSCILKACGITGAAERGKQVHDEVINQGLLAKNVVIGTALVDMYAKCGALEKARLVLNELPTRNVASWNALISGYTNQGFGREALDSFHIMQQEGHFPTAITYMSILKACGITGEIDRGKEVHDKVVREGLLQKDARLGAALIDMYAKCGSLRKAMQVMNELPVQSTGCWNALMSGYVEQSQVHEAISGH